MHKFLRAAGFSMYQKNKDIRALLRCLSKDAAQSKCIQIDRDTSLYEVKAEVARLNKFLSQTTSTVRGTKKYMSNI